MEGNVDAGEGDCGAGAEEGDRLGGGVGDLDEGLSIVIAAVEGGAASIGWGLEEGVKIARQAAVLAM